MKKCLVIFALLFCSGLIMAQTINIEAGRMFSSDTLIQIQLGDVDSIIVEQNKLEAETRASWLWASSIETDEKLDKSLANLLATNLNTVFVMVPPIEDNFGYGTTVQFQKFIEKAVDEGLSVHAWFPNGRRQGSGELDFRPEEEQAQQVDWVRAIMENFGTYLDGIHLDYIRYVHGEDVNLEGKMDAVTSTVRRIRQYLLDNYSGTRLTAAVFREVTSRSERLPVDWDEDIPPWFRDWYWKHQSSIYKGGEWLFVPMFLKYQQDPITWVQDSLADAVFPMQYSIYIEDWISTAEYYKSFIQSVNRPLTCLGMGLGWVPKPFPDSRKGQDPEATVKMIKYGRKIGVNGYSIFILNNHEEDDTPLIEALTIDSEINNFDAPFKEKIASGLRKNNEN